MSFFRSKKISRNVRRASLPYTDLEHVNRRTQRLIVDTPRRMRVIGYIVVAVLLVIYLIWQVVHIVTPPELVIEYPRDEIVVTEPRVLLSGHVEPHSTLYVNNEVLVPQVDGTFEREVALQPGVNSIEFKAHKRYSKITIIERTIIYKQEAQEVN